MLPLFILFLIPLSALAQQNTWTGTASDDWNNAGNWSYGTIPKSTDHVVISAAAPLQPMLAISAEVYSLSIENNATLNISQTGNLLIRGFSSSPRFAIAAITNLGTINNDGKITAGDRETNIMGFWGIISYGTFTNSETGEINVVQAERYGLVVFNSFDNRGKITIQTVGPELAEGFQLGLNSTFTNAPGAELNIGNTGGTGLVNGGTFENQSKININVVEGSGLWCVGGSFSNSQGAEINLLNIKNTGLIVGASEFTNSSKIDIRLVPVKVPKTNTQAFGLALEYTGGKFINTQEGEIRINNYTQSRDDVETLVGYTNRGTGQVTNMGKMIIGDQGPVGSVGVENKLGSFDNKGCHALLNVASNSHIFGGSKFINSGTIIENGSQNSDIGDNQGAIQNINGGVFTVESGNPPVNLSAPVPPTDLTSNLTASQTEACPYTTITLDAGCSVPGAQINWNPGQATVTLPGDLDVYTYRASCQIGDCISNETTVEVKVIDCTPPDMLSVPTAFSPNGDQINDVWILPDAQDFENVEVRIYNRWGELIFADSNGYQNPWDGTYKGVQAPAGPYPYIISYIQSEKRMVKRGTVLLLR